jgi:hypothetical protein
MSTMAASAPLHPPERRVRQAPDVLSRAVDFGVVLLAPVGREPLTLEGTGRALWDALAEPVTPSALAADLARAFAADPARVASDIAPILAELTRVGAIEELP